MKNNIILPIMLFVCAKAFSGEGLPLVNCPKAFEINPIEQIKAELQDPSLRFAENFKQNNLTGDHQFFVVQQRGLNLRHPIGRIIKKTSDHSAQAEVIDPADHRLIPLTVFFEEQKNLTLYLRAKNPLFKGIVDQGSPHLKDVFRAVDSSTKEVFLSPQPPLSLRADHFVETESALKNRGYGLAYIRHIDQLRQWQIWQRQFKQKRVNPYTTHIHFNTELMESHLNYIQQGVAGLATLELKQEALKELNQLREQALVAQQNKKQTYEWWLKWNLALSHVIRTAPSVTQQRQSFAIPLLEYFPMVVAVPTLGEVGVMALNESGPLGIYPIGLTNKAKPVDGTIKYSPAEFAIHDVSHAMLSIRHHRSNSIDTAFRQWHNELIKYTQKLEPEERKNIELAYYILTHEMPYKVFLTMSYEEIKELIEDTLLSQIDRGFNFNGLQDFSHNTQKKVDNITQSFMKAWVAISFSGSP